MKLLVGDALEKLKTLDAESVQTCVTSPPYWGLRNYGMDGQIGLERTPQDFVDRLVELFREVRRVLRKDGTVWLNLGDCYATGAGSARSPGGAHFGKTNPVVSAGSYPSQQPNRMPLPGLKSKDLILLPARVALALQADGWWLRSEIIWNKPNGMPSSVTDRPTLSHEKIFLLTKRSHYYYNAQAVKEPAKYAQPNSPASISSPYGQGFTRRGKGGKTAFRGQGHYRNGSGPANRSERDLKNVGIALTRNRRSVWTVATMPFKGAHFATFPPKLIEPCILAGSPRGGLVLDPFAGTCTTGYVAAAHGREFVGIELNPEYAKLAKQRVPGLEVIDA